MQFEHNHEMPIEELEAGFLKSGYDEQEAKSAANDVVDSCPVCIEVGDAGTGHGAYEYRSGN